MEHVFESATRVCLHRRFPRMQDPLEASDLEAEADGLQQHADASGTASFAARLAAETLEAPGAAKAEVPDVESGPFLETFVAAAAAESPGAPRLEPNILERTATPDGLPQPARDLLPAATPRCACACCCASHTNRRIRSLRVYCHHTPGSFVVKLCQAKEHMCLRRPYVLDPH